MSVLVTGTYRDMINGMAITCMIFALAVYMPLLGFFISLSLPLPTLFYRVKLGRAGGMVIPVCSAFIMAMILGNMSFDMLFFTALLLLGFMLGELFEKNLPLEKTVIKTVGTVTAFGILALTMYGSFAGTGLSMLISEYVRHNLQMSIQLYESMGMPKETIRIISDSLDTIHYIMVRIIPSLTISLALLITWTTLLIAKPMLMRSNLFYPKFGSLNKWKAPDKLVWIVIGCGFMLFLPDKAVKMIAVNGLIILMTIYFFGGIAITSYFFEKKKLPLLVRAFFYSLIALWQVALFLVIGIGFFDIWFNFRKLETIGDENQQT